MVSYIEFFVQIDGEPDHTRKPVYGYQRDHFFYHAKSEIAHTVRIPISQCIFLHKGMPLNDFDTLEECRIEPGEVLMVCIRDNNRLLIRDENNLPKYFSEYFPQHVNAAAPQPEAAEAEGHDEEDDNDEGDEGDEDDDDDDDEEVEEEDEKMAINETKHKPNTSISENQSRITPDYRGEIEGIPVGTTWMTRMEVHLDKVHRPPVAGIAGTAANGGAVSIVLSGGYIGDKDQGDVFTYSGSGSDEELKGGNLALAVSCAGGFDIHNCPDRAQAADWKSSKAIRVIRGFKGDQKFSPKSGYRYDGIYKVSKYWKVRQNGKAVFKYELRRDDLTPLPWIQIS